MMANQLYLRPFGMSIAFDVLHYYSFGQQAPSTVCNDTLFLLGYLKHLFSFVVAKVDYSFKLLFCFLCVAVFGSTPESFVGIIFEKECR